MRICGWFLVSSGLLLVWAIWPPRSPRMFAWSVVLLLAGLVCLVIDLAVDIAIALLFIFVVMAVVTNWGLLVGLVKALWNLAWLVISVLFVLGLVAGALIASLQTSRPYAAAAAWLIGIAVLLAAWAFSEGRSPGAMAGSILLFPTGLAFVATHYAVEGRTTEIALWLPLICVAAAGLVYVIAGTLASDVPGGARARVVRVTFGLTLLVVSYGVAAAVAGWDLSGLAYSHSIVAGGLDEMS